MLPLRRLIPILCVLALVPTTVVGPAAAVGDVIHVDQSATGTGDGTSWTDAYPELQEALPAGQEVAIPDPQNEGQVITEFVDTLTVGLECTSTANTFVNQVTTRASAGGTIIARTANDAETSESECGVDITPDLEVLKGVVKAT